LKKVLILLSIAILIVILVGTIFQNNFIQQEINENNKIIESLNTSNSKLITELEQIKIEKDILIIENLDLSEQLNDFKTISRNRNEIISISPTPSATPTPKIEIKQTDLEMLARIIYCEAGGEPEQDQLAVGQVVLNRMKEFHLTLKQTIYQKNSSGIYVFSPVASSSYSTRKFSNESKEIAARLLAGEVYKPVGGALYFCTIGAYNKHGWHYQYVTSGKGVITLRTESTVYIR